MAPLLLMLTLAADPIVFDRWFEDKTMRVDVFHTGNATEEHLALDRIVADGIWPGSTTQLLDPLEFGKYLMTVVDPKSGARLYSRGFATIYGEWETTGEARKTWGAFHESLRFPWPKQPVRLELAKRDEKNVFQKIWSLDVDPASRVVNPAPRKSLYATHTLLNSGDPKTKVDLVILGDGYTAAEMDKYHGDARRLTDALFKQEPFRTRKGDFNVYLVDTPSPDSGVNRPHAGVFKRTALTAHYSSFDSERYVLSYDNRTLREVASAVPYEYMVILVNEQTYGGGGIYLWQATAAVDNAFSDYLFVHEFGHHFASLADEYYTSDIAYELPEVTVEPFEPNLTALLSGKPKWAAMIKPTTPLPTPWGKEAFEARSRAIQEKRRQMRAAKVSEAEMEKLFNDQKAVETAELAKGAWADRIGAFEGAGYRATGYYRPASDCMMFTRDDVGFCAVCAEAINRVINLYAK